MDNNSDSSYDDRRGGGASFYGPMTGIVNEARGTGNATAFKGAIHHGPSRESTSSESDNSLERQGASVSYLVVL